MIPDSVTMQIYCVALFLIEYFYTVVYGYNFLCLFDDKNFMWE